MTVEQPAAAGSDDRVALAAERIAVKLDQVAFRLEKLESQSETKKAEKGSPWYVVAVQIIGIPTAVLVLALQWYQVRDTSVTRDKTVAETVKLQDDDLKTRAELQQILDNLAQKRAQGIDAYEKAIADSAPKIQETLHNLKELKESATFSLAQRILVKFVIVWALYQGIGLLSEIIMSLFSALLIPVTQFANSAARNRPALRAVASSLPVLIYLPGIAFWAIRLFIFGVIVLPFVAEIVGAIGGTESQIHEIIAKFAHLRIVEAAAQLRALLFGSEIGGAA